MDKKFFNDLCKEEAILVEKLRVLRDFKSKFFEDGNPKTDNPNQSSTPKPSHMTGVRKTNRKVKKVTVADKVLNSLAALGVGKSREVAEKLLELYPSEYKNKVQKAIGDARYQISDLLKLEKVEIVDQGEGNSGSTYRIKEKKDDVSDIL